MAAGWMLLLAGCAGYGPQGVATGATESDIAARMGPPTGRYARDGATGERLEYARGPYGRHTYMLDLDATGRLADWKQVLTENDFNAIPIGLGEDQVLYRIGHPAQRQMLSFQSRWLWSYRYESPFCQWFQVSLDLQHRVVETGYGPDPLCDDDFLSMRLPKR